MFKGLINGVPEAVLSGGRYDGLLCKMKRRGGAAGFAVYLDTLEALDRADRMSSGYEVDTVLLYEDGDDPIKVSEAVMSLTSSGVSVLARRGSDAGGVRCRRVTTLKESEADGN